MKVPLLVAALAAFQLAENSAAQEFAIRDGDTVVFFGDSITERGLYTSYVETFIATRFPKMRVRFINSGWSGEQSVYSGGGPIAVRLKRDIVDHKPAMVTVLMGMNDGHYAPFDQALFELQTGGYRSNVETLRRALPDAKMTILGTSPYDDVTRPPDFAGGYNSVLLAYDRFQQSVAEANQLIFADLNAPVVSLLQDESAVDVKMAQQILPDRIHPGPSGALAMAGAILQAWNAPSTVTSVEIDAAKGAFTAAENTTVSELKTEAELSWKQSDQALPMPFDSTDAASVFVFRKAGFGEKLAKQTLRVTNLRSGEYRLTIDNSSIGVFSADELGAGINLAAMDTPMTSQAAAVHALTQKHNAIRFTRWRNIQTLYGEDAFPNYQAALDALDRLEADAMQRQQAAAVPVPRAYRLTPQ